MNPKLNLNDISCKKQDFERAFYVIKENLDIESEKNKVKKIIGHILKLSKNFNLDTSDEHLKTELLCSLMEHGSLEYYGLAKKVEEILNQESTEEEIEKEKVWKKRILRMSKNFLPFYQGIRDNETGEINKYEALVRYVEGGEVFLPSDFIHVAKKHSLLVYLSKILIKKIIKEMQLHKYDISINIDGEISSDEIIEIIFSSLEKYDIEPSRLTIEILETIEGDEYSSGKKYQKILKNIKVLKEKGIKISVDDYGAGYSTNIRVLDTDPDFVKIDGNMIKKLTHENVDYKNIKVSVESIVNMVHGMGKLVIAEHIDNQEIQEHLINLKVSYSQGFFYSKPSRDIING